MLPVEREHLEEAVLEKTMEQHTQWVQNFNRLREQVRKNPAREQHVKEYVAELETMIAGYEDGITWQTTCLNCARLMNDNYNQYCLIEELKKKLDGNGKENGK